MEHVRPLLRAPKPKGLSVAEIEARLAEMEIASAVAAPAEMSELENEFAALLSRERHQRGTRRPKF